MSTLFALSVTTGILCGLWVYLSGVIGVLAWVGFAGCTSYFAAGGKRDGFKSSIISNISGVFWAMVIIVVSNYIGSPMAVPVMTAIVTFIMCIQAKIKYFSFIPGTFIGSFSTFALNGNWKAVLPTLLLGAILGVSCDWTGDKFYKVTSKNDDDNHDEDK